MNIKNIFPYKKIYFIGIGGVSMSGLCEILLSEGGYTVLGSDNNHSELTENLVKKGVTVYIGQNENNITPDIDLVVYTAAIKEDNPEFIKAKSLGLKMLERSTFLGELMKAYKYPICIAGTHGKTTTSSMTSEVFLQAKKDPTISIGGILSSINSNFKVGKKDYLVLETCEYCDTFLKFNPHSAIILNIDEDHLDYFKNIEQIYDSFKKFAMLIKEDACLVINSDIEDYEKITDNLKCNVITYGQNKDSMWQAKEIIFDEFGCGSYKAYYKDTFMYDIKLNVVGLHNVYNSLSVCALAHFYNIDKDSIEKGLNNFKGTNRRFQYKGTFKGVKIIDDYAHHPTEILATINAAKAQNINKLWCVFQPHTYTRTKALLDDFAKSLLNVDNILITDIYSAREKDTGEIHSKDLVNKIKELGKDAIYIENFECGKNYIEKNCQHNDMLITMGAGNVYLLGEMLLS
ncbi:UDP-N-acetylmuramate--L-alanine ligase [[Clostridium] colinum]|uniref:UDP-N-acetylmuramate--L-alanine ligase n=1 Tax=[Clostridium] colinum TaxID=36835 RepID=UPI002023DE65|nr:UDP-N-acetylmuramate--L-alanine ligase [[Clostridium] colinum]